LADQFHVLYGMLALAGLRLARARNREPAPLLTALWVHKRPDRFVWSAAGAFATGLLALVGTIALIKLRIFSRIARSIRAVSTAILSEAAHGARCRG
jgi:hypothetical protein